MIGKGTTGEKPVTLAEVLEILEAQKKKGELSYTQRLALDHAQKFMGLKVEKARELVKELVALGLREHQAVMVVDHMPETKADLQLILAKERVRLGEEDFPKVLEIVNKYRE